VIADYNSNGTLLRAFIYGDGIDEPICMAGSSGMYYYHYDGLGSVVALTDTSGTFVEYYEYNVFGEPTIWDVNAMEIVDSSVVGNPYMFTGREYDSETGLYDYRNRIYKPSIGRFLQTDPIRYAVGLNLYSYCGNNPIIYVDPYGLVRWGQVARGIYKIASGTAMCLGAGGLTGASSGILVGAGVALAAGGGYQFVKGTSMLIEGLRDNEVSSNPVIDATTSALSVATGDSLGIALGVVEAVDLINNPPTKGGGGAGGGSGGSGGAGAGAGAGGTVGGAGGTEGQKGSCR
jgi:RHS repeat-associated protein